MAQNPGLRGTVRTTLDLDLQATVERLARSHLSALNRHDITQAAVVVVENATGAIRAMVGSENYAVSQINGATQPRSCGSTLKPFVYLEAIDKRLFTAASLLPDTPDAIRNEYADYDPQNYSHHYFGPVRLREALACSLNVPAVFVLSQLGARPTFYQLQKWGFNFPQGLDEYGAGFVLGNAETRLVDLAAAYAGLARGGTAMRAKFLASEHQPLTRIASAERRQQLSLIFCAITTRARKVLGCVHRSPSKNALRQRPEPAAASATRGLLASTKNTPSPFGQAISMDDQCATRLPCGRPHRSGQPLCRNCSDAIIRSIHRRKTRN